MFNNKSKPQSASSDSGSSYASSGATNSIVSGTKIEGTVETSSDIRVDGNLKGTLNCKGRVIIGPSGMIEGEVECQNAVIEGKFTGNLIVKELLNIKESAEITGDIKTDKLLVQSGAIFNVTCSMGGQMIKSFEPKSAKKEKQVNEQGKEAV